MKILLTILTLVLLASCSDASRGAFSALGKPRDIKCYSGGQLIYQGQTTGKIENEDSSDGYFFTDSKGEYIEIKADCIFTVKEN